MKLLESVKDEKLIELLKRYKEGDAVKLTADDLGVSKRTMRREISNRPAVKRVWQNLRFGVDYGDQLTYTEFVNMVLKGIEGKSVLKGIPYNSVFEGKQKESAVAVISDCHIGKKNSFLFPGSETPTVTYNLEWFTRMADNYINHLNEIIQLLSPLYDIEDLYIFQLGDLVDNDLIFKGQRFYIDIDVGKQVLYGINIFRDIYRELLKVFKRVHVVNIPGNHGRPQREYESGPATRSFDYFMGAMLKLLFEGEERIDFKTPDSYYFVQQIYDWRYYLHHGNTIRQWMGFPYYGTVRQSKSRRTVMDYNIEIIGHFHNCMEIPINGVNYALVNGSWIPYDSYGWENWGSVSYPAQYFFGVSPKRVETWRYKVDLLDTDTRLRYYQG